MKTLDINLVSKSLYKNYGQYISRFRAIPYYVDVLRPVERRMLLSLYDVARSKFVKSAKVVGHCMGNYHPHAEAYSTLVRLVKLGFAIGQGNWGSNGLEEDPPAAMRYTEVRLDPYFEKLAFELIDFVEWKELEFANEPVYLPSPIPLGLIGNTGVNQGIAFHKTSIPTFNVQDLFHILFGFVLDDSEYKKIYPKVKLDGHTVSKQNNSIFTTGKGEVVFIPQYSFKDSKTVELYGVPQTKSKFYKFVEDNNLEVIDYTTKDIRIVVRSTTNRNIPKDKFLTAVEYKVTYNILTVDEGNQIIEDNVISITERCYSKYKDAYEKHIKHEIDKTKELIDDMLVVKEIKKVIESKGIKNENDLIRHIKHIPENRIKEVLTRYSIRRLVNIDTDISKYENQMKELSKKLKYINKETVKKIKELIPN